MSAEVDPPPLMLPDAPALVAGTRHAVWMTADGEPETLTAADVQRRLVAGVAPLLCHAPATARRLGLAPFPALDLLELFAFVLPARFCLPTPRGLAEALGLALPVNPEEAAASLYAAARALLGRLADVAGRRNDDAVAAQATAWAMARGGWPWGGVVLAALGAGDAPHTRTLAEGLRAWNRLPEWQERSPPPPPDNRPVEPVEARARLVRLLGGLSEDRPQQAEYASLVSAAFMPRDRAGEPRVVLAEAGTGVGKTLGYLAPASVWAEKNRGPVWISTFTRNLQRQLDGELDRVYPDPAEKARSVVVRKGRENYLCLLNMDEAVARLPASGGADAVALGLIARWAAATRDGDMIGGDFPAWLASLLGPRLTLDLTDTRGECIYSACSHFGKCFIERSVRDARRARIVVANHALVLVQAALGGNDEANLPTRYVFDEGHHLFAAADSAFSAHLTGRETAELRRWILGGEGRRGSRARGMAARLGDLVAGDGAAVDAVEDCLRAARALPGPGWLQRLAAGAPMGAAEAFLGLVRQQVYARDPDGAAVYDLETEATSPVPGLLDAAAEFAEALGRLTRPVHALLRSLFALLDVDAFALDSATRQRIESICRSLERRAVLPVNGWISMLKSLSDATPPEFADWFGVARIDGRDVDVGMHRHWVDPMRPFAETIAEAAHGLAITSATLRDGGDSTDDWRIADRRTGVADLGVEPQRGWVPSPFDYAGRTRVLVITDVNKSDAAQVAAAYRELFLAAGGGGLGLFTAISRLRAVHQRIAPAVEAAGLSLYAQHVDAMDTGTLVDIFRAEENACLLGTDAMRDGVDVPGRSLRLIVFDRVPWPRPDILHRARREAFGGRDYDDMLTRLKLKQAYGRLLRRADDRGAFVVLDRAFPSRLAGAFPGGVILRRMGLAQAIDEVRDLLAEGDGGD